MIYLIMFAATFNQPMVIEFRNKDACQIAGETAVAKYNDTFKNAVKMYPPAPKADFICVERY
jgi:hypothetical protein